MRWRVLDYESGWEDPTDDLAPAALEVGSAGTETWIFRCDGRVCSFRVRDTSPGSTPGKKLETEAGYAGLRPIAAGLAYNRHARRTSQGWVAGGLICGDISIGGTTLRVVGAGPRGGFESIKGTYERKLRSVRFRLPGHGEYCRLDRFKVRFKGHRIP